MAIEGVDYSWARPSPQALRNAGKTFACRYLHGSGKGITAAEYRTLVTGGIAVVLNYEHAAGDMKAGYDRGVQHAREAERYRQAAGIPVAPIYFSADWDAQATEQAAINAYLNGAASVVGPLRVGVYGSYSVVERCARDRTSTWFWQTYAWSGGRLSPRAHLYQWRNGQNIAGSEVDFTRALATNYGQVGGGPGTTSTGTPTPIIEQGDNDMNYINIQGKAGARRGGTYAIFRDNAGNYSAVFIGAGAGPKDLAAVTDEGAIAQLQKRITGLA